ncbi:MAG: ATP phosphoribosyltransferase [Christensenellales bacterium]|jgi:ATP phosphoribosyltransferase
MGITIALSKGRLAEEAVKLLSRCGIDCADVLKPTRKLELYDTSGNFRFILVKPSDVTTYVEYGVADIGVSGKDTLLEEDRNVLEMLDLKFGKCRLCTAGKSGQYPQDLRVATKYVNIARKFFNLKSMNVEIIKLNGSIELGPVTGLSDIILDVVESGKTLAENGLKIIEEIYECSARLVVNMVSLRLKQDIIKPLIDKLSEII